ncbi:hypothetical protein Golax_002177, partial [Gossypium laxum]|nr:hypothetical protein [Gossypium laxum]
NAIAFNCSKLSYDCDFSLLNQGRVCRKWDLKLCTIFVFYGSIGSILSLFRRVNVSVGEKEDRLMITGLHTVADIFCIGCGSIVGWKYLSVTRIVSFRNLPMRRARSTKKENPYLNGLRCLVLMEAIIGLAMKHMLVEVMQMMFD